jgi:hypothetical protein
VAAEPCTAPRPEGNDRRSGNPVVADERGRCGEPKNIEFGRNSRGRVPSSPDTAPTDGISPPPPPLTDYPVPRESEVLELGVQNEAYCSRLAGNTLAEDS